MDLRSLFYLLLSSSTLTMVFILTEYLHEQDMHLEKVSLRVDAYLYPRPWTLINLPVQYLINSPVCHSMESVFILIVITSHAGNLNMRNQIRHVLPKDLLQRLNITRLFLTARVNEKYDETSKYHSTTLRNLLAENETHKDIVTGDFYESYKNLTYKHLMGLQWASRFCSQAEFIVKQDDDIIVDFYQMESILKLTNLGDELKNGNSIAGKVLSDMKVVREKSSKWFVPKHEYKENVYPPFVSGWAYITTMKVIQKVVKAAEKEPYFWIDDLHITGTLALLSNTKLIDISPYFTIFKGQLYCCIATSIANSKSKDNRPYWCDFLIGPSNDDLSLMQIFYEHSLFCHTSKVCTRRSQNESLIHSCVVTNQMILNKSLPHYRKFTPKAKIRKNQAHGEWKLL